MITTEIALLSAFIGATAGILSQIIGNTLRDKTDKQKIIFECISEERKLAHLLFIHTKRLEQTIIRIEYYFQLASTEQNPKTQEQNLLRYHDEINFSGDAMKDYHMLVGDYSKNIHKLMLYIGHFKEIEAILAEIISYKFEDSLNIYKNYEYPELHEVYHQQHYSFDTKLEPYKQLFDDMHKKIQYIKKNHHEDN